MPKRVSRGRVKYRKPRYTSKAYQAYLRGRSPGLGLFMMAELLDKNSRPGFARRLLGIVSVGNHGLHPMVVDYRALPEARPYDRRIVLWPVEPECIAFRAKYVQKPARSANRSFIDAAFDN